MLTEFRNQLFQLPLIATTWTYAQDRYLQEKANSSFLLRFTLSVVEQSVLLVNKNIIKPILNPYHSYFNNLDHYLCTHIDSIRRICPVVDQTSDELIQRYGDLFLVSFFTKTFKSSSVNSNPNDVINHRRIRKFLFIERYFQFLTNILMIIEMYSKYIQNELNDYIDITRNLWKNLNMEDGRSLDEVESFSEKLLVLGRRMTGNYRQFLYLIRYQFKRGRYIIFSFLHVQNRFRLTVWRITQKIHVNDRLNNHARDRLMASRDRFRRYLEMMMVHATKHPWMKWTSLKINEPSQPQLQRPLKFIRPIFFVSSNNTSDCSEPEDNLRNRRTKMFESTPYRKYHQNSNRNQSKMAIDGVLSNISSSSSDITPEQSFDVKDIIRQVAIQSERTSSTSTSIDQDAENRIIEQALNESDDNGQLEQQQQPISVFDLSPMLASGCAV